MGDAPGRRPGPSRWRRVARVAGAALAALVLGGCRINVSVEVEADAAGGGRVRAAVHLDAEALAQVPDLAGQLRVDDLEAAGWEVEGPTPAAGGGATVEASKPFSTAAAAAQALAELGPPFAGLRLTQDRGFWRTRSTLAGPVDLSAGLGAFGDAALAERLGSPTLGLDPADLERELGRPLAEVLSLEVVADLPGAVDADAPGRRGGDPAWAVALGATTDVRATSEAWNRWRLAAAGVALLSGATLTVVVVRRSRRVSWG